MHKRIGIRVTLEATGVRNFNAAQDQFPSRDQRVHVVTDANMDHTELKNKKAPGKRKKVLIRSRLIHWLFIFGRGGAGGLVRRRFFRDFGGAGK
jgi:hypothetical protein